jgi:hypothetical protein
MKTALNKTFEKSELIVCHTDGAAECFLRPGMDAPASANCIAPKHANEIGSNILPLQVTSGEGPR